MDDKEQIYKESFSLLFNKNFHSDEFSDQSNFIFISFILHFMEYIKPEPLNWLNSYFDSNNFNIEKIVKPLDYLSFDVNFNSQKCIAYKK